MRQSSFGSAESFRKRIFSGIISCAAGLLPYELFQFVWVRLGLGEVGKIPDGCPGKSCCWLRGGKQDRKIRTQWWRERHRKRPWVRGGSQKKGPVSKVCDGSGVRIIVSVVRNMRNAFRLALLGITAVGLGTVACAPQEPVRAAVKDDKDRKTAPEFTLKDATGKVVHLSDFKGKVVLVDFWATWCGPCAIEIPWFVEFQRKYKDRGLEVVGISMDDDGWKAITPFVANKKINYRILLGDDTTGDLYGGVEALPTTFVVDRNGRVASVHVGLASKKDFEDAIEKLLETPATAAAGTGDHRGL
jgi:peroxiredoxin